MKYKNITKKRKKKKEKKKKINNMLSETIRRKVARKFMNDFFAKDYNGNKITFELWKSYNSMTPENEARAFRPYPRCFVSGSISPYIGVAETKKEAFEIMKLETPEERYKNGLPEIEKYGKYWVVFD